MGGDAVRSDKRASMLSEPDGSTVPGIAGIGTGSDGSVSGSGGLHGRCGAGIRTV